MRLRCSTEFSEHTVRILVAAFIFLSMVPLGAWAAETAPSPAAPVDWKLDCRDNGPCVTHFDGKGVQILVGRLNKSSPVRMVFRVSAMAKSNEPVAVRLDDGWQAALRVGKCSDAYCEVVVAAESTTIALSALSRNSAGVIAYHAKDRILIAPFTLKSFVGSLRQVAK